MGLSNARIRMILLSLSAVLSLACGAAKPDAAQALTSQQAGYEVQVISDGVPLRTFAHGGETYVLGTLGTRYVVRVHNRTAKRVEAVVSIDGRDVMDGEDADFEHKRGYLISAWGYIDIDGWRVSEVQAAAFRFSSVPESYAAQTGSARHVGVIGVAVFPERDPIVYRRKSVPFRSPQVYRGAPSPRPESPVADSERARSAEPSSGNREEVLDDAPSGGAVAESKSATARPGLGTEFGEALDSHIQHVSFTRQNAHRPAVVLGMRYNDRHGLLSMGIDVDGTHPRENDLRRTAQPFPVSHHYAKPPIHWRSW